MKASELIAQLQALIEQHGNMECKTYDGDTSCDCPVRVIQPVNLDDEENYFFIE